MRSLLLIIMWTSLSSLQAVAAGKCEVHLTDSAIEARQYSADQDWQDMLVLVQAEKLLQAARETRSRSPHELNLIESSLESNRMELLNRMGVENYDSYYEEALAQRGAN